MGAEASSLEECSLDVPLVTGSEFQWEIRNGITFENDKLITVFTEKSKKKENCRHFERNIKFLKSIRHPNILHYIRDGTGEDRYIVTERATPLSILLKDLSPIEVASGICNIISALSFLHDKANICHNNVCIDTIYVSENGHWKLGGFECACRFTEASPDFLNGITKIRNECTIAPEELEQGLNLTPDFGHVRDVYSFGVMVDSLLEQLEDLDDIIKTFELRVQDECLNSDPKKRPKLHTFLDDKIFSNDLLYLSTFLHQITLKSKEEREEFYRTLLSRLESLHEETVGKHLVQPLLCRFVLLDKTARDNIAPHILTPVRECTTSSPRCVQREINPLFKESVYRKYVIPELYKAFCCHEINIRRLLLQYFPCYVDLFDKEKLEDVIFPQILLGMRDSSEELAALSLHCLADMIPILGRDVVIGGRSKTYFVEGSPKNVNGIIQEKEQLKNVNGVIGKVKLKDLVPQSKVNGETNQIIQSQPSREEKMKEAKEKREQRRLERQNKKNLLSSHVQQKQIVENISNITGTDHVIPTEPQQHVDENVHNEVIDLQPEVFCNDNDDWSDWEEETGSLNDDLSNVSRDQATSPTNSSVSIETTKSNSSHMHSTSTSSHPDVTGTDLWSNQEIRDIETNYKSAHKQGPSSGHKQSPMSLKGKAKPIKPKSNEPLGAEFDIHNIEIKLKQEATPEVDFFADMMPDFKPAVSNVISTLAKSPGSEKQSDKSSIFSYTAADIKKDTVGTGWDNDGWDVEGF